MLFHDFELVLTQSKINSRYIVDFYSSLPQNDLLWKKLSGNNVWTQVGFCRKLANFGWPVSDDGLLFAALLKVAMATYRNVRLREYKDTELVMEVETGFFDGSCYSWLVSRVSIKRTSTVFDNRVNPDKDIMLF